MRESRGLNKLASWIAGYDVFISYRHADAHDYARALEQILESNGLMVFRDETEEDTGVSLDTFITQACRARAFVVLATPTVFESTNVFAELSGYLKHRIDKWYRRPFSRIISINVDQTLSNAPVEPAEWSRLSDFVYEPETLKAIGSATPSNEVVERLSRASTFMRSWRRFISVMAALLIAVILSIVGASLYLKSVLEDLSLNRANLISAQKESEGLKTSNQLLGSQNEGLKSSINSLTDQKQAADIRATTAQGKALVAEAIARREEQKAQYLTNDNLSREMAVASMSAMPTTPSKLSDETLKLAMKAVETRATPQAVDALRQALLLRSVIYTYRYGGRVKNAAISSDGSKVVTVSTANGNEAWVWSSGLSNPDDGSSPPSRAKLVGVLKGHTDQIYTIAFSPDGRRILTASKDGSARIWVETSIQDGTYSAPDQGGGVREIGGFLSAPKTITPLPIFAWRHVKSFSHDGKQVRGAAFAHNGRLIVTGGDDGTVKVWNEQTEKLVRVLIKEPGKLITSLVVSNKVIEDPFLRSNGLVVVSVETRVDADGGKRSAGFSCEIRVISVDGDGISFNPSFKEPTTVGPCSHGLSLNVSPSGRFFAAASPSEPRGYLGDKLRNPDDPVVAFLGRSRNTIGDPWIRGHKNEITSIAFSPDNQFIATASVDRAILLWKAEIDRNFRGATKESLIAILGQTDRVNTLSFSSDGRYLIAGCDDETVFIRSMDQSILFGGAKYLMGLSQKRVGKG